jgi:murein DD-endopeptidase MepM/ murein hydrolase activator NlpD
MPVSDKGGVFVDLRLFLAFVFLLAGALPASLATAQEATPAARGGARSSAALLVEVAGIPMRVAGSDGQDHIEYDLLVTNAFTAPATLSSLEVLGEDGGGLLTLEGDALAAVTQTLFTDVPTAPIPANGAVAIVVDVIVPPDLAVEQLTHRLAYELPEDAPARAALESFAVDGPVLTVSPQEQVVVEPPLRGPGWVAANGCCLPVVHRSIRISDGTAMTKAETFAVDWIRLQDGALFSGDGTRNEDWYAYGADVYSATAGTVVSARNDMPDETPFQAPQHVKSPGDYGGNHVMIEVEPGVYAFYAHLAPGSVTVEVGDTVQVGDVLGKLGNTGSTGGPHLHFGLLDYPDPLVGNSLPMVFAEYVLEGSFDGAIIEAMDGGPSGGELPLTGSPEPQTETLQLVYTVADFGG